MQEERPGGDSELRLESGRGSASRKEKDVEPPRLGPKRSHFDGLPKVDHFGDEPGDD
jgi:hypothetical protein